MSPKPRFSLAEALSGPDTLGDEYTNVGRIPPPGPTSVPAAPEVSASGAARAQRRLPQHEGRGTDQRTFVTQRRAHHARTTRVVVRSRRGERLLHEVDVVV